MCGRRLRLQLGFSTGRLAMKKLLSCFMSSCFHVSCSAHQPQLRLLPHPSPDPHMLAAGGLEMLQVLLQRRVVELGEKLGLSGHVEATDIVDELTFVHG